MTIFKILTIFIFEQFSENPHLKYATEKFIKSVNLTFITLFI